jgi:sugar phosphate isomerase/epimerase
MNTPLNGMTRRAFLGSAALAALSLETSVRALTPIPRVGGAQLKPALNAYSFLQLLKANAADSTQGIDLFGVCDFAAQQNLDAVDLTGYFFPGYPQAPSDAYLARIKHHTHNLGLAISGTGVRNDFATDDQSVRGEGVALTKRRIEVAAKLGAPVVRVFAGPQAPHADWQAAAKTDQREEVETWMAAALRDCAAHGATFGVRVAVQNHGDFIRTGEQHLDLLRRVDHEWCGALVDTGMYFTADPYADIAMLVPYAVNWQIKENLRSRLDSPRVDMKKLVNVIRAGGYRDYLPIETLAMGRSDYDPHAAVIGVLKELRAALATPD